MPLQNRVTPDGSIVADAARGLLMGNRGGQMHVGAQRLTARRWVSKAWIACVLQYKDRHEVIMAPGHYTQLFFLDEATALAAGHRPCALCRRADWLRFMDGWQEVRGLLARPKVADVDAVLQAERVGAERGKVTYTARLADLPEGVMVYLADSSLPSHSNAALYFNRTLYPWTPSGYVPPVEAPTTAHVLTPLSIVAVIAAGYAPMLHPTARSMSVAKSV